MAIEGMDVEEVRSLVGGLHNEASFIDQVTSAIGWLVVQLECARIGPDATEFAGWWQHLHEPRLGYAEEAIDGLSQSCVDHAAQQEAVSRAQFPPRLPV